MKKITMGIILRYIFFAFTILFVTSTQAFLSASKLSADQHFRIRNNVKKSITKHHLWRDLRRNFLFDHLENSSNSIQKSRLPTTISESKASSTIFKNDTSLFFGESIGITIHHPTQMSGRVGFLESEKDKEKFVEMFEEDDLLVLKNDYESFLYEDEVDNFEISQSDEKLQNKKIPYGIDATISSDIRMSSMIDVSQVDHDQIGVMINNSACESSNSIATKVKPFVNDVWTARLLLIAAAAMYATNFTVVKIINDHIPVGISTTIRFAFASLATLPWLLAPASKGTVESYRVWQNKLNLSKSQDFWEKASSRVDSPAILSGLMGIEIGLWCSVGYLSQAIGLQSVDASKSALICSLAVVTVPILDFLTGKKILLQQAIGIITAVAGVSFLEFGGDIGNVQTGMTSDELASLIQPVVFGMGFWKMEAAMRRFPYEATRLTAGQLFAIFLTSIIYCYSASEGDPFADHDQIISWITDPMLLGALLWTGVMTTAVSVYMETLALKTLSAAETTMIFLTEPVFGASFAAVFLGENFGMETVVGALLILCGCYFSSKGQGQGEQSSSVDNVQGTNWQ